MSGNNQPVVCAGFKLGNSEQARSIGYQEELSPTLNAECGGNKPAVVAPAVALDMTHACDVIRECGEQVPALQARMGTGGNQVPLTYSRQAIGEYKESSTGSTCSARDFKDSTDLAITHMVVRRLTPMECERLQGFPDHWTDIGEWIDEKGKKHKDADSPRYKALGNSIALPFWDWMLRRMARYLPEGATLGSLFDGIGGFPLCFERIHGKGTARWASEIEQFPIAVTKKHFSEEE
nr:MAG TPA: Cytosine specific methyltransferase [Bacteriophage sp.]